MSFVVYRVECPKCKLGPHTCHCDYEFCSWLENYSSTDEYLRHRPGMLVDVNFSKIASMEWSNWVCCFINEEKLQWWFSDLLEKLAKQGFQMASYEVKNLAYLVEGYSKRQYFFKRAKWHNPTYKELLCPTLI